MNTATHMVRDCDVALMMRSGWQSVCRVRPGVILMQRTKRLQPRPHDASPAQIASLQVELEETRKALAGARREIRSLRKQLGDDRYVSACLVFLRDRVEKAFEMSPGSLCGPSRLAIIARARMAFYHLAAETGKSMLEIARAVHRTDHTTAISGIRRAQFLLKTDPDFVERVAAIRRDMADED